jgi:multicomponent Na+:H+ antiporter subunit E
MRPAARGALLVGLWLLAWGEISLANVLSGVAVAAALLVAFPASTKSAEGVRPHLGGILRLGLYVTRQLLVSNVAMAVQIIRGAPHTHAAVLSHRLAMPSEQVVTVMTSIISLSPGTMTVDVDDTASTIYVHFFDLPDIEHGRAELLRLEHLVTRAITPRVRNGAP